MAELYFGFAVNSGAAAGSTTSGYSYATDPAGDGIAWNADVTTVSGPVWGDSGQQLGLMVLVYETGSVTPGITPAAVLGRGLVNRTVVVPIRIGH